MNNPDFALGHFAVVLELLTTLTIQLLFLTKNLIVITKTKSVKCLWLLFQTYRRGVKQGCFLGCLIDCSVSLFFNAREETEASEASTRIKHEGVEERK